MRIKYLREESRFIIIDDLGFYVKEGPKNVGLTTYPDRATRYKSTEEAYNAANLFERSLVSNEGRSTARHDASALCAIISLAVLIILSLIMLVLNFIEDWKV